MPYCYRHPNRETFVSCSECGRPICAECMTPAPVGQRCPEHSGKPQGTRRISAGVRRGAFEGTGALVTKILLGVNILIYVITIAQSPFQNAFNHPGGFIAMPTPAGVPVETTSPGSSVNAVVRCSTMS